MPKKYDQQIKARAVRLVRDHLPTYGSVTKADEAVGPRLGISGNTLHRWVVQADVDDGVREGVPSEVQAETAHLRRLGTASGVGVPERVSHRTVDRLMRDLGQQGVRRGKKLRTTIADPTAPARSPGPAGAGLHRRRPEPAVGRRLHLMGEPGRS